jgi:hypothetical protein
MVKVLKGGKLKRGTCKVYNDRDEAENSSRNFRCKISMSLEKLEEFSLRNSELRREDSIVSGI